tara:strand:+ start:5877 stop:6533 length:657 start_codon:yes stop_codon:yes gene_type:complete
MAYKKRRTRKNKKSKRRRQYGGKYQKGGGCGGKCNSNCGMHNYSPLKGGKRRRRRTRKSRKRNQKGGAGCGSCNSNQGKFYTLREYNNLANGDVRNFYENTNSNHHVPTPYQKGGGRGTVPQQLGPLGDLFNGWHRFSNAMADLPSTWRGKPGNDSALPHIQPKVGGQTYRHDVPNFVKNYNDGVRDAASIIPPSSGGGRRRRRKRKSRKKRRSKRRR